METLPFASKPSPHSVWGCSDLSNIPTPKPTSTFQTTPAAPQNGHASYNKAESSSSSEASFPATNYEYMPAVLLNSLKRDKKPFTYTPGRIDLSEVLNEKLRKRNERRRKRAEERAMIQSPQSPVQELPTPTFESPKQVLVLPTYNSPLNMYSMENALEALEVQAEIAVSEKSLSPDPPPVPKSYSMTLPRNYKYEPVTDFEPKNVTQSKAFKVLQIITDTEEEAKLNGPQNTESHTVEMRFSGNRGQEAIPSKYFHNLQKMVSTDGPEPSSPAPGLKSNVIHHLDEVKFTATRPNKAIPSKLFHNLQKLTGTEEEQEECPPETVPRKPTGPVQGNSETFEIKFRPQDDMMQKVKNTLQMKTGHVYGSEDNRHIPTLQRPAAFLPPNQSLAKSASCYPRFNAANRPHYQANSVYSLGK